MAQNSEYLYQKPSLMFWIGQLMANNINVKFNSNTELFKGEKYWYL